MTTRKAEKQRVPVRQRILQSCDQLFYQQGIQAVGVDAISAHAGISKRTLYNHFPSKDALIAAYLARRASPVPDSDAPPDQQILKAFDWLGRWLESDGFRGCPFANAAAELADPAHPARRVAAAYKGERQAWFEAQLERLGVPDPGLLALQLMGLVEGAITTAVVQGRPEAGRAAGEAAKTLLRAAGVATEPGGEGQAGG
ncbi:MAG: TetR/AcrR family transcriptional regulator [Ectothiorhodospiraceae bacterium]|nr:TetR/AcrR family transcriptional regulator [Ectothiorhodospiraceae bacterium]